ncbi:MAG TPA: mechanosensitive ion channel family protein [Nitrospiraceae bacterium]|nr:mechanosensitive ion channel family protein [Nitrospiraceae bacterium]
MDLTYIQSFITTHVIPFGWTLLGALAIWVGGSWTIRLIRRALSHALTVRGMDHTLIGYLDTTTGVLLKILLLVAVLGTLGVATTSFAAIIAAAGVAIGMAWSGLLANFAAGVFLIVLRPFRVGDVIAAAGVTGEVQEIGVFATALHTGDNLRVVVGNNKIFSDNIVNYSTNPFRGVDMRAQLAHGVEIPDAIARLKQAVSRIPNVVADPAPLVEILEFNAYGTLLVVRPFCHNRHYWQVYFDTNRAIQSVSAEAGYPVPETRQLVRSAQK